VLIMIIQLESASELPLWHFSDRRSIRQLLSRRRVSTAVLFSWKALRRALSVQLSRCPPCSMVARCPSVSPSIVACVQVFVVWLSFFDNSITLHLFLFFWIVIFVYLCECRFHKCVALTASLLRYVT